VVTIEAVIFDFGGVLWDMRWDVAADLAKRHGLPERALPETLYTSPGWLEVQVGAGDRDRWRADAHAALESMAACSLPPLHDEWRTTQHPIAENIDLVRRLRPPYRTAVLSNADSTLPDRLRDGIGIYDLFDDVVCSALVELAKPDPAIYALSAERLGLPPAACVFVDDSERNIEAARAAGMPAIFYRVDRGDRLEPMLADLGVRPRS
jgi:putative hydrolase of the HAD superfamily